MDELCKEHVMAIAMAMEHNAEMYNGFFEDYKEFLNDHETVSLEEQNGIEQVVPYRDAA